MRTSVAMEIPQGVEMFVEGVRPPPFWGGGLTESKNPEFIQQTYLYCTPMLHSQSTF